MRFHWLCPDVLLRFRLACPAVQLQLRDMSTPDQISALVGRDIDIGFVRRPVSDARLVMRPVLDERLVVALVLLDILIEPPGTVLVLRRYFMRM